MCTKPSHGSVSAWLAECHRPALLSHQRPDGDSLGAMLALKLLLAQLGIAPRPVLFDPIPQRYACLADDLAARPWDQVAPAELTDCDSVIIVDTCALAQLAPAADWLAKAPRTLVIDHHATRDDIATRRGDVRVIDVGASATCLLVAEWAIDQRLQITPRCATALFVGIATDCGWFRFSNTDARTLRVAARLVEAGAAPAELYSALFERDKPARLRLIARMLSSLEIKADGRLAVMYLRQSDFAAAGADAQMAADLVQEAARLGDTEATLLFIEQPDGSIRVNLRSKRRLDVAALAREFGGGGHARAAGARLTGDWETAVAAVVRRTQELLEKL